MITTRVTVRNDTTARNHTFPGLVFRQGRHLYMTVPAYPYPLRIRRDSGSHWILALRGSAKVHRYIIVFPS